MADPNHRETIDEVINDLDELKTSIEELEEDAPADEREPLKRIRTDLDDASSAADDIEENAD